MDALQLLTWSLILYLFASLASLFLLGLDRLAIKLSGITSLVGGVIGIVIGWGIAMAVSATGLMTTVVSIESVVLAFGFSAAIGIFFGLYPANRAAGLKPIEALRYE